MSQQQILKMLPGMRAVEPKAAKPTTPRATAAAGGATRRQEIERALARREQWEKLPLVAKDILKRAKRAVMPAQRDVLADEMLDLVRAVAKLEI